MKKGRRKEHHHSHWGRLDTWDKMAAPKKPKLCCSLGGLPLVNNCLCQSGTAAPSKLHLPPELRGTEVAKHKKTEDLTAFSTAG